MHISKKCSNFAVDLARFNLARAHTMKKITLLIALFLGLFVYSHASQSVWMQSTSSAWMQSSSLVPWKQKAALMPFEEVRSTTLEWRSMSGITRVTDGYHCVANYAAELSEYGEDAPNLFDTDIISPEMMARPPRRAFDDSPEAGDQSEESPIGSPLALSIIALAYGVCHRRKTKLEGEVNED